MNSIEYNDFKSICRICLFTCGRKFLKDHLISDIYYKLSSIQFETNDELPQQICLKCFEKIVEIDAFGSQCKQSHSSLIKCLNEFKSVRVKEEQETIEETNEITGITDELTIEDHKLEFIKVEFNLPNENVISKENIEVTMIPEPTEVNSNEEMSDDSTNQNDLKEDANSDNKNFKCDICTKTFKLAKYLKRHKVVHSCELPFDCKICNKKFKTSGSLNKHKRRHSDERRFVCKICSKTFKYPENLNKHIRYVHSDERPHECKICNKTFAESFDLKKHIRRHSSERPFQCKICNKTFTELAGLTQHLRIHSGERRFACNFCDRTFIFLNNLKIHERTHTGERPFVCNICNKTFTQANSLKTHLRSTRVHENIEETVSSKKQDEDK